MLSILSVRLQRTPLIEIACYTNTNTVFCFTTMQAEPTATALS